MGEGYLPARIAAALVAATMLVAAPLASAAESTVTIEATGPNDSNCYPFGLGGEDPSEGVWKPFAAFVYKNVPPFDLWPGRPLSFDTRFLNETAIKLEISLAATTVNVGDVPAGGFTK